MGVQEKKNTPGKEERQRARVAGGRIEKVLIPLPFTFGVMQNAAKQSNPPAGLSPRILTSPVTPLLPATCCALHTNFLDFSLLLCIPGAHFFPTGKSQVTSQVRSQVRSQVNSQVRSHAKNSSDDGKKN